MSWIDITVIVVPLVLAGIVALLLIRTILQSRKQSTPQASSQASRPKRSTTDQSPPARRDPPSMQSLTAEENENKTTNEDSVFGQAGRDRVSSPQPSSAPPSPVSSPAPSPPPSLVETFWSDFKGKRGAKFISFINFKGGVGKSTCAAELSAALASQHGKRVLLIDLDPQTNATFYFMDYSQWEHWQQTAGSLRTLFDAFLAGNGEQFDISCVIKHDLMSVDGESIVPNLHLLPSHLALVLIDIQLAAKAAVGEAIFSSQAVIRQALQRVQDQYDYIIFDCPPNFNLITQNGLFASDSYVIPAIPDYLSTLGISLIQGEVSDFSERIGTALSMFGGSFSGPELLGVIFTRVRLRSKKPLRFIDLHERRIHEVHRTNPGLAFKGFLSESVRYAEAPERHMPVCLSSRKEEREAKAEILHLAGEFLARFEQPGLQQEAAADAAPFQPEVPGMTQDEMSPTQGGQQSPSETTEDSITLAAKSS